MKKRILSFLLTAIMILTMMPIFSVPAFAADPDDLLLLNEVLDAMQDEVYVSNDSNGNPVAIIPNKDNCYSYNFLDYIYYFKFVSIDSAFSLSNSGFDNAEKNDNVVTLKFKNLSNDSIEISVTIDDGVASQVDVSSTAECYLPYSGLTYKRSYGLFVSGKAVTQDNAADILNDGKVSCVLDANGNPVLTLNNASIPYGQSLIRNTGSVTAACVEWFKPLTISLQGTNNLIDGNYDCNFLYCLSATDDDFFRNDVSPSLSISGSGKLNMDLGERLIANNEYLVILGINADEWDLVISESEIYMHFDLDEDADESVIYGLYSEDGNISIKDSAKVTVELLGDFAMIVPGAADSVTIDESELYLTIENTISQVTYGLALSDNFVISDESYVSLKYTNAVRSGQDLGFILDEVDIDIADTLPITNAVTEGGTLVTSSSDLSDCSFLLPNDYTLPLEIGTLTKSIVNEVPVADKDTNKGFIDVPAKSLPGETVTLTVNPNTGYQLKADTLKASYNDGASQTLTLTQNTTDETKYTFTMPAYDVEITAEFEEIPSEIKVTASSDKDIYLEGEFITITATVLDGNTPVNNEFVVFSVNGSKYKLKTINGSCSISKSLPAGSYTISACYEKDGDEYKDEVEVTIMKQPNENYIVKFDLNNGNTNGPEMQTIEEGKKATKPENPTYEGFVFAGWYTDKDCTDGNEYDFDSEVKEDFVLYAKWISNLPETHLVVFDTDGHDEIDAQKIKHGEKATKPADPSDEGWIFEGWYSDAELTKEYDFNTPITADIKLFAKWTEEGLPIPPDPEPKPVEVYYAPLVADLKANEEGVIEWKAGDSLPLEAVKLLVEKPELSLEFTFTYEGEEHTIFIPAGAFEKYYDVTIPWYGPAWLIQYFEKPEKDVIEYTIVKDDTLNALAEKFKCTVEEILALNPYISDKHWIYPKNKLLIPVQK